VSLFIELYVNDGRLRAEKFAFFVPELDGRGFATVDPLGEALARQGLPTQRQIEEQASWQFN
jgi:hypothetical protein